MIPYTQTNRRYITKSAQHSISPYMRGFCKVAHDAGISADQLIKIAWWDSVKSWASDKWNGVKNTAKRAVRGVKNFVTNPIGTMKNVGRAAWDRVKRLPGQLWNGAKKTVGTVWDAANIAVNGIATGIASIPGVIGGAVGAIGSLPKALANIGNKDGGFWSTLGSGYTKGQDFVEQPDNPYWIGGLKNKLNTHFENSKNSIFERHNLDPTKGWGKVVNFGLNGLHEAAGLVAPAGALKVVGYAGKLAKINSAVNFANKAGRVAAVGGPKSIAAMSALGAAGRTSEDTDRIVAQDANVDAAKQYYNNYANNNQQQFRNPVFQAHGVNPAAGSPYQPARPAVQPARPAAQPARPAAQPANKQYSVIGRYI